MVRQMNIYKELEEKEETQIISIISEIIRDNDYLCNSILNIEHLNYLYDINDNYFELDEFLKTHGLISENVQYFTKNKLSNKNFLTEKEAHKLARKILKNWEKNKEYENEIKEIIQDEY